MAFRLASPSVRTEIIGPVVVGACVTCAVGTVGVYTLQRDGSTAQRMYTESARPLGDFTDLRDMLGDSRWEIRDYVLASSAKDRADLKQQILATDSDLDAALDPLRGRSRWSHRQRAHRPGGGRAGGAGP